MGQALHILLVEAEAALSESIGRELGQHVPGVRVRCCRTVADACRVDLKKIRLVLCGSHLPDGTGLDLLGRLLAKRADLPVVVLGRRAETDVALEAIRLGAYDYVAIGDDLFSIPLAVEKNLAMWRTKQENVRLAARLARTLDQVRLKNRQLEGMVRELKAVAATDPLTGLANRRAIGEALRWSYAQCTRYDHDLACVMIDLDGFKPLNDALGHPAGDRMLQAAARVMAGCCRQSDVAGRFGGDEFLLVLPQTDMATAARVARRVAARYEQAALEAVAPVQPPQAVTMSMGVATLSRSMPGNPRQLVAFADRALYLAKEAGKGCVRMYRPSSAAGASPRGGRGRTSAASRRPASLSVR